MSEELMGNQTQPEIAQVEQQTEQPTTPVESAPEPFLKVVYDKNEMALDRDKAVELAQKGLNYDRVYEKYKTLETDPRLTFVENVAKHNGMDTDQFMKTIMDEMENRRLDQESQKIMQAVENNNLNEITKELMESRQFRQQYEQEQNLKKADELKNQELMQFIKQYPEITVADIPPEVWDATVQGVPLIDAYSRHENRLLREKLASLEQDKSIDQSNQKNAQSSTGSLKGQGEVPTTYFTADDVRNMSQTEVRNNLEKIHESMKSWNQK